MPSSSSSSPSSSTMYQFRSLWFLLLLQLLLLLLTEEASAAETSSAASTCTHSSTELLRQGTTANQNLNAATEAYEASLESSVNGKEWSFVFPSDALETYEKACATYNDENDGSHRNGFWLQQESGDGIVYTCDMPKMNIAGKPVRFANIGECVANTGECHEMKVLDLIEKLWSRVGFECEVPGGGDGDGDGDNDGDGDGDNDDAADSSGGGESANETETESITTTEEQGGGDGSESTPSVVEETTKDSEGEGEGDNSESKNSEGDAESSNSTSDSDMLTPGDENTDTTQKLPFMTDDDLVCLTTTLDFQADDQGLTSAENTYKATQYTKTMRDTGRQILGYPWDAAKTLRSACEDVDGYWGFVKEKNFTCAVKGTETIELGVKNFGSCLAPTDECKGMDPTHPLLQAMADKKIACWEEKEQQQQQGDDSDGDDSDGDDSDGEVSNGEDSNGEDSDGEDSNGDVSDGEDSDGEDSDGEDGDADDQSDGDTGTDSANDNDGTGETTNDKEDTSDGDGDGDGDAGSSQEEETSDNSNANANANALVNFSESELKCLQDSEALYEKYPDLEKAMETFGSSMIVDMANVEDMKLGFVDEDVERLREACRDIGYFTLVERDEFECDMMSVGGDLVVTNIANCVAVTDDCKKMDPLSLMENVWENMGIQCTESTPSSMPDSTNSTASSSNNDNESDSESDNESDSESDNDNDGDGDGSGSSGEEDDPFAKALGLTKSEVACMSSSTGFIADSEVLTSATKDYQKSVQMTDPTRLGYKNEAASQMKAVCEDQGGLWSFVMSEDVTCHIHGRDRCIHVYNFGNCISNNNDCQSMDPMVLVRGFFLEVLGFECKALCDTHKEGHAPTHSNTHTQAPAPTPHAWSPPTTTNHHSPPTSSTYSKTYGASSSQNSSSGNKQTTPSSTVAAVVVCLVIAVGFFGFYRYRAGHQRERIPQADLEMADMSDLRFESLT